ncbi:uncharacterized protein L969DRAFT_76380 [Mixia osmundae IAM 14324]|uniref:FAD-binding domain-containing protein n=1 Tax=Mixia osmundae (strain CBS 9802 / IAM 14324 / JCM 22182 / KY 12970) TaxID=764103 RepID=G7E0G0_MIXOS|nr:uncharacterized protein L969DRAFT_76380 [Mixia osmundae IAM 14324]KEI38329.1 hypothetical protein L969DRAFT_76380 [Mixia osmundae IAM 14324]GAA96320.1 hypothetical protein E5Q_02986 [Mixia osmundae IAM 14324]
MTTPIVVCGSGIAGAALVRVLHHHGLAKHCRILERAKYEDRQGHSLTLHDWAMDSLDSALGEKLDWKSATVDALLSPALRNPSSAPPDQSKLRLNRARLQDLLQAGWKDKVEHEKIVKTIETDADGVSVLLESGEKIRASVVIACDGVHSIVRRAFLPNLKHEILDVVMYSGQRLMSIEEAKPYMTSSTTSQTLRQNGRYAWYSFNNLEEGDTRLQWAYGRRPQNSKEDDPLWKPERTLEDAQKIPDALYTETDAFSKETSEPWHQLLQSIKPDKGDRIYNWLMRSMDPTQSKVHEDRVALLGDARHSIPLLVSEGGACHALVDGAKLGEALANALNKGDPLVDVLSSFESNSTQRWSDAHRTGREAGMALVDTDSKL